MLASYVTGKVMAASSKVVRAVRRAWWSQTVKVQWRSVFPWSISSGQDGFAGLQPPRVSSGFKPREQPSPTASGTEVEKAVLI